MVEQGAARLGPRFVPWALSLIQATQGGRDTASTQLNPGHPVIELLSAEHNAGRKGQIARRTDNRGVAVVFQPKPSGGAAAMHERGVGQQRAGRKASDCTVRATRCTAPMPTAPACPVDLKLGRDLPRQERRPAAFDRSAREISSSESCSGGMGRSRRAFRHG